MKIFHAAEVVKGGVATVLNELLNDQSERSNVESIAILVPQNEAQELNIASDKVRSYFFNRMKRGIKSSFLFLVEFCKIYVKERPDVVHLHSSFAGTIGRIIMLFLYIIHPARIIYCPHGFSFLISSDSKNKVRVYKIVENILSRFCYKIVCVSNYEKNAAIEIGISKRKLVTIYNGINPYDNNVEHPTNEGNELNLLFVGRLEKQKGFDLLIAAFNRLSNKDGYNLVVVGEGSEKPTTDNKKKVIYKGWLRGESLSLEYYKADVIIVPSRWEGFAMVPLEAMKHKIPIIASDSTSLPEAVENNVNGLLFESENVDQLVDILSNVTKEELAEMGKAGYTIFKDKFSSEKMADTIFKLYTSDS